MSATGALVKLGQRIAGLAEQVAPAPMVRVPILRSDVHDLTGLAEVGDHLFGRVS